MKYAQSACMYVQKEVFVFITLGIGGQNVGPTHGNMPRFYLYHLLILTLILWRLWANKNKSNRSRPNTFINLYPSEMVVMIFDGFVSGRRFSISGQCLKWNKIELKFHTIHWQYLIWFHSRMTAVEFNIGLKFNLSELRDRIDNDHFNTSRKNVGQNEIFYRNLMNKCNAFTRFNANDWANFSACFICWNRSIGSFVFGYNQFIFSNENIMIINQIKMLLRELPKWNRRLWQRWSDEDGKKQQKSIR